MSVQMIPMCLIWQTWHRRGLGRCPHGCWGDRMSCRHLDPSTATQNYKPQRLSLSC